MKVFSDAIADSSTNVRTPTVSEIGQGFNVLSVLESALLNGFFRYSTEQTVINSTELVNLLDYAGITPSAVDDDQVAEAVVKIVDDALIVHPSVPVGGIIIYAGLTPPTDYLICDGLEISRTTYSDLFTAIGEIYGIGDGSSTFNLPNTQCKVPLSTGSGAGLTTRALNDQGGEETHVLTEDEMPSHSHDLIPNTYGYLNVTGGSIPLTQPANRDTGITGGDVAHENMSPYIAFNFIIRAT